MKLRCYFRKMWVYYAETNLVDNLKQLGDEKANGVEGLCRDVPTQKVFNK